MDHRYSKKMCDEFHIVQTGLTTVETKKARSLRFYEKETHHADDIHKINIPEETKRIYVEIYDSEIFNAFIFPKTVKNYVFDSSGIREPDFENFNLNSEITLIRFSVCFNGKIKLTKWPLCLKTISIFSTYKYILENSLPRNIHELIIESIFSNWAEFDFSWIPGGVKILKTNICIPFCNISLVPDSVVSVTTSEYKYERTAFYTTKEIRAHRHKSKPIIYKSSAGVDVKGIICASIIDVDVDVEKKPEKVLDDICEPDPFITMATSAETNLNKTRKKRRKHRKHGKTEILRISAP